MSRSSTSVLLVLMLLVLGALFSKQALANPFRFEWTATVTGIEDGEGEPATMAGVSTGDALVAHVVYDTTDFGAGTNVSGDGLDYAAPAGLQMTYSFDSGGLFLEGITAVRARDGGSFDQWNWKGGSFGGLLFQTNDFSDSSWDLPLPTSFDAMHDLFLSEISNFAASGGNHLGIVTGDPLTDRTVHFGGQAFSIVPEPTTALLLTLGLAGLGMRRRG